MAYKFKEQERVYQKQYRQDHKEELKAKKRLWYSQNRESNRIKAKLYREAHLEEDREKGRAYKLRLKIKVLSYYSGGVPTCSICGETRLPCLSIDHINSGGTQHLQNLGIKGGTAFYRWLVNQDFPEGFQTLCMNCQFMKRFEAREYTYVK